MCFWGRRCASELPVGRVSSGTVGCRSQDCQKEFYFFWSLSMLTLLSCMIRPLSSPLDTKMKALLINTLIPFLLLSLTHGFVEERLPKAPSLGSPQLKTVSSEHLRKRTSPPPKKPTPNPPVETKRPRTAVDRKKWGIEQDEYWFDHRIHTLGNTGVSGALHAAMAPISTKVIDMVAYHGIDLRKQVSSCSKCSAVREKEKTFSLTTVFLSLLLEGCGGTIQNS